MMKVVVVVRSSHKYDPTQSQKKIKTAPAYIIPCMCDRKDIKTKMVYMYILKRILPQINKGVIPLH
jgi:hypothetical protein